MTNVIIFYSREGEALIYCTNILNRVYSRLSEQFSLVFRVHYGSWMLIGSSLFNDYSQLMPKMLFFFSYKNLQLISYQIFTRLKREEFIVMNALPV